MAKSRNRSRDARKRAAKKRKNRDYQTRKLMELAKVSVNPFNGVITHIKE